MRGMLIDGLSVDSAIEAIDFSCPPYTSARIDDNALIEGAIVVAGNENLKLRD